MTIRIFLLLAMVAVLLVACGPSEDADQASAVPAQDTVTVAANTVVQWQPFASIQKTFPRGSKPIFLYLFQDACDHCAHMDSAVFGRAEIAHYLNSNFIPVKVDPYLDPPFLVQDSMMSDIAFRQVLAVQQTPAYYFFDRLGRVAGLFHAEMDVMLFKRMLVYIQDGYFGRTPLDEFMKLPAASESAINARF